MKTCCFLGHRKIDETEELKSRLKSIITNLIEDESVEVFLFGSSVLRINSRCEFINKP